MAESFAKNLFHRRVPQIMGMYLAAGWAALEFTDFLVNRFVLSPHLTDLALLTWALIIPTVFILAWFHGAPGPDRWTKVEKIGIPINLTITAVFLIVAFGGKELGAATESLTLENETGETVERVVPKSEFRKGLVIYFFDNASGDTALDWLRYGVPMALDVDLEQDLFVDARDARALMERFREQGFDDGLDIPFTLKRELAENIRIGYFLSGSVSREQDQFIVTTSLYETRRGKLIQEREYLGSDPLELVDRISLQTRSDVEIPSQHIEETTDLPVSEMLTSSLSAYRSYVNGAVLVIVSSDLAAAVEQFQSAVEQDPLFTLGQMALFETHLNLNEMGKGLPALEAAMSQLYKLPERTQLQIKAAYFWLIEQDINKALTAAGMRTELFPEDVEAQLTLAQLYTIIRDLDRAISAYERAVEIDPSRINALLQIGELYASKGEFEKAIDYQKRYSAEAPDDSRGFITLGNLYRAMGDHESARREYNKALVVDPNNVWAVTRQAQVDGDLGRFDRALQGYQDALAAAITPDQRRTVYQALEDHYELRGQPRKAVNYMHLRWAEVEKSQGPFSAVQEKLQGLDLYVAAGMTEAALDTLASVESQLAPPFDVLVPLGQLAIALELEDADSVEAALEGYERFIQAFSLEYARANSVFAEGRVLDLRGDCEQAIYSYRRTLELEPRQSETDIYIGRCYRKLGRLTEAKSHLQRALDVRPFNPRAHYEMGVAYADEGDDAKAREHLETALDIWADAEPGFEPAQEARDKLVELGGAA